MQDKKRKLNVVFKILIMCKLQTAKNEKAQTKGKKQGKEDETVSEMNELKPNSGPLTGVKVLDLTRVLAGPFCTMWLATMGADVIKIENPKDPDVTREYFPIVNGKSAYFPTMNHNKRAISLNLKAEKGKKLFLELVKDADAVVENFRPGVMDKLGLGYDELKKVNPGIVYASISGYGTYGPYSNRPGYDPIAQAMSGIMSLTGPADGEPYRVGPAIGDTSSGVTGVVALLAALVCKLQTGLGQKVEVALVDSLLSLSAAEYPRYFAAGEMPARMGNHARVWAPYGTFKAADGYYNIACGTDKFFWLLAEAIGRPEMANMEKFRLHPDRIKNFAELEAILTDWAKDKTKFEACEILSAAGVPCAPVYTIRDLEKDEHIAGAREMFPVLDQPGIGEFRVTNIPVRFSGSGLAPLRAAPEMGAHNEEIYGALGCSPEELARLREEGVI